MFKTCEQIWFKHFQITIDDHNLTVISSDGRDIQPVTVSFCLKNYKVFTDLFCSVKKVYVTRLSLSKL